MSKVDLHDLHNLTPLGGIFTNVPRPISADTRISMNRVRKVLEDLAEDIPVFNSKMSKSKVYRKTLWQSVPVQKISGPGTRDKGLAVYELPSIEDELKEKIEMLKKKAKNGK